MSAKNLLIELLVEELPPKALKKLGEAFGSVLLSSLKAQGLANDTSALTVFSTPRRLGAHISHVLAAAPDKAVSHKLMPASVGLTPEGRATPALLKKLSALGADESAVPQLSRRLDGKAETLFLQATQAGAMLAVGAQKALDETLAKLPIPKVMQYQLETGTAPGFQPGWTSVNFVRPAHGLVALHGAEILPLTALGLQAGRQTQGHRFEAPITPVMLQDADHYARQLLEQGAVIASFEQRRAELQRQLNAAAAKEGLTPIDDAALLDEVTALVERPNVLTCQFEAEFLTVPPECLILTMKANQKYFPLLDAHGTLTNKFLVVSNIQPADASRIVQGNERVVRPRLADAKFFFDQDRKKTLASRVAGLGKVVYHNKLGTQGERVERVRHIAQAIATRLAAQRGDANLLAHADQAAQLAKTDLTSDMVGEFPELQGTMGRYYALHDGLDASVADAIEDHYKPRFAGDSLPRGEVGLAVALADKLETLAGLFGVGQIPTGDKDPFALRRHALGVIRMLIERDLPLAVSQLVAAAFGAFPAGHGQEQGAVQHFLYDRLVGSLREQGYTAQEVDAVVALRPERWGEIPKRLAAVRAFAQLPEAPALAAANKRVGNILKKAEAELPAAAPAAAGQPAVANAKNVDTTLLAEPAERALHAALLTVQPRAQAAQAAGDLTGSLRELAALRVPVDAFFDDVMVNAPEPALRANRLALLAALHQAMNRVADLSRLAA